jgi:hypothetical protein
MFDSVTLPSSLFSYQKLSWEAKFLYILLKENFSYFDKKGRLCAVVDSSHPEIEKLKKFLGLNDHKYQLVLQDLYMSPFTKITDDFNYCYFLISPDQ